MTIQHLKGSNSFTFKAGARKKVHFLFELSDLSTFGNIAKKPMKVRGNFRKCRKILLGNKLNELSLVLNDGDYFEIGPPVFTRGRTKKDIEEYSGAYGGKPVKVEPPRLEVQITIPAGNAIKVYSIDGGFFAYLVNQGGSFYESDDFLAVEEVTGVPF